MAKGMLVVRGAGAQAEADEADHAGTCVGEVVHTVGGNGHAAEEGTNGELACKQKQVAKDACHAGQVAVRRAHGGFGSIFAVFDKEADEPTGHSPVSPFCMSVGRF